MNSLISNPTECLTNIAVQDWLHRCKRTPINTAGALHTNGLPPIRQHYIVEIFIILGVVISKAVGGAVVGEVSLVSPRKS